MEYLIETIPPFREFLSPSDIKCIQQVSRYCERLVTAILLPSLYCQRYHKLWISQTTILKCEYFIYGQVFHQSFVRNVYPDNWTVWIDTESKLMYKKKRKIGLHSFFEWMFCRNQYINFLYTTHNFIPNIMYFETTMVSHFSHENGDCITIGYTKKTKLHNLDTHHYLLGWSSHSFGLHSDDGYMYYGGERICYFQPFGPTDTIGIGINLHAQEFFVTKNGYFLDDPRPLPFSLCELQPSVITDGLIEYTIRYGHKTPFICTFEVV